MNTKNYFIYIATNKTNTVLYTGITNNLVKRIYQHKNKIVSSFSSKYNINKLVYYEVFQDVNDTIKREKQIKAGSSSNFFFLEPALICFSRLIVSFTSW
ncbi:hypothetical protein A3F58_03825, partial [Candidatus Roizmanbacteria bacterium RIFCSPHIGHO2_12_FULL_37_9b]